MNFPRTWHYDVESFKTFFCATFLDDVSGEVVQFAVGCGRNDLAALKYFITSNWENLLVGFNNISYDDAVLRLVMGTFSDKNLPSRLFELSGKLVSDYHRDDREVKKYRYPPRWEKDVVGTTMDLFKIMHFDRLGVSLKQVAINLKHERIQDLPYPYDYEIKTDKEVETVMEYNINDVIITQKLFRAIQPQIKLREELTTLYNVDLMNASDSKMGNLILGHYYKEELGIDPRDLKDLRTKRPHVLLGECIPDVIQFETKEFQDLRWQVSNTVVFAPKYGFSKVVSFRGTRYSLGIGGIHSMEEGCKFEETAETKIISCDIGSMYPTCIIINNIYPEHLGEDFVKVLSMLTAERLAAKKTNKKKAEALKITVNGLYGKLNSSTFWLEDAKAMMRVTIAGQLYILMLVEMLELAGIHCISANTDGIECEVQRDMEETYYRICEEWEKKTGFTLEFVEYKKYVKRDVNNYVAVGSNDAWFTKNWRTAPRDSGKVKTKGAFIPEIDLKKGYKHPIVPRAIVEYFVNGTPVEETVFASQDIMDFCISQKTGKGFWMELVTVGGIQRLQKNNRFYISHANARLQKNDGKKVIGMFVGKGVTILNDYNPSTPFDAYDVNVHWYIREAKDIIELIEPSSVQLDMFGGVVDFGSKTKMQVDESKMSKRQPKVQPVSMAEVYNAHTKKARFDVDPKYCVVTKVNTEFSPVVTLYSLAKGTENTVKIPKETFTKFPLQDYDIILADVFQKRNQMKKEGKKFVEAGGTEWWMLSYTQVSDVSEWKRKV
jgi:hypothetical protein